MKEIETFCEVCGKLFRYTPTSKYIRQTTCGKVCGRNKAEKLFRHHDSTWHPNHND